MAKRKTKLKKKLPVEKCNGVIYKGVLWYYEDSSDFIEALDGFKLWFEVDANNATR